MATWGDNDESYIWKSKSQKQLLTLIDENEFEDKFLKNIISQIENYLDDED